jgi:chemotaxis protein CheD
MMQWKRKERRKTSCVNDSKPYFDHSYNAMVIKVLPGEFVVTSEPSDMLVTTLGSCVSACIRNPYTGLGGMNHFMLPSSNNRTAWAGSSAVLRYGNHAMETLINEILGSGCAREELEIKVFGGGNVTNGTNLIGSDNAEFVLEYLHNEGLKIKSQDLGGTRPRRIHFFPATGKVDRLLLRRTSDNKKINYEETAYQNKICHDVELSDD